MSQLKVNSISDAAGANGNAITLATDGTCTVKATNKSGRNLIINGAMQVAQRATSSTNHGYSTVDRAKPYATSHGTSVTYSQSDVASGNDCYNAGFRKAFKVAISGAGNTSNSACYIGHYKQRIEAQNIAQSGWRHWDPNSKLTLSFWIKSTTADTFQLQFYVDDNTKKKYNTPVTATTSWTKITKTIPGHADININNDTGEGFAVQLVVASGADLAGTVTQNTWVANTTAAIAANNISTWLTAGAGNVETTGWQLEVGDYATDFEHLSYGDELAKCQRYYYLIASGAWGTGMASGTTAMHSSTDARVCIDFPVQMRAAPSVVQTADSSATWKFYTGSSNGTATDCDTIESTQNFAMLAFYSVSGSMSAGAAGWFASNKSVARLAVSSEL